MERDGGGWQAFGDLSLFLYFWQKLEKCVDVLAAFKVLLASFLILVGEGLPTLFFDPLRIWGLTDPNGWTIFLMRSGWVYLLSETLLGLNDSLRNNGKH